MKITLKTLPQATAQQVFDQVKNHLLTQNKKSQKITVDALGNEEVKCLYRDDSGNMCAAGCLIGDDEYNPKWEGDGWLHLIGKYTVIPVEHRSLITDLQVIHDEYIVENWEFRLKEVAKQHNLVY